MLDTREYGKLVDWHRPQTRHGSIDWWLAVLIFLRDIGMIVGGAILAGTGRDPIPADRWGKTTTVFFYVAIVLVVVRVP